MLLSSRGVSRRSPNAPRKYVITHYTILSSTLRSTLRAPNQNRERVYAAGKIAVISSGRLLTAAPLDSAGKRHVPFRRPGRQHGDVSVPSVVHPLGCVSSSTFRIRPCGSGRGTYYIGVPESHGVPSDALMKPATQQVPH